MSTPSRVRNAWSSSDKADWDKAIGGSPSVRDLVVSHRRSRRWPPTSRSPAVGPQTPPPHGTLLRGEVPPGLGREEPRRGGGVAVSSTGGGPRAANRRAAQVATGGA